MTSSQSIRRMYPSVPKLFLVTSLVLITLIVGAGIIQLEHWPSRAAFFIVIGATVGGLMTQLRNTLHTERRQHDQLNMLHEIDKAILADQNLDDFLRNLVETVGTLFEADACYLYLLDNESGDLQPQARWDLATTGPLATGGTVPPANGRAEAGDIIELARLACSQGKPFARTNLSDATDNGKSGLTAVMAAPLFSPHQRMGSLLVGRLEPRDFPPEQQVAITRVAYQAAIALKNIQQLEQLNRFGYETLAAFTEAIAQRDQYTGAHVSRIVGYTMGIAKQLDLPDEQLEALRCAAQLHDIGKLAIPTDILRKPGPLNEREWDIVRQHPEFGGRILERVSVLKDAVPLVQHHHERYDGTGYPSRLSKHGIPLGARIISVADAFDAMTSDRPYRPAMSFTEAVAELRANAGRQFDPRIVHAFVETL